MSENVLSSGEFPTMGTSVAKAHTFAPVQGGTLVKKTGNAKGGTFGQPKTATHRHGVLDREAPGGIRAYRLYQNAPCASENGQHVHVLPSKFTSDGR